MPQEHSLELTIKIDGTPLSDEATGRIEEVIIDDRLQLPATFVLRMNDFAGDALSRAKAKIGAKIEISSTPVGESAPTPLFTGEITALEGEYFETGAWVVVRGYDLSHRLQRGRHTESYQNMTDSQIAQKIAQRHGIPAGQVERTSTTFEHVAQAAVSDWDFLKARAREIGYEISVTDGKFNFRKPKAAASAPGPGTPESAGAGQLVFNGNLLEFRPRKTAGAQVSKVAVRSWDPKQRTELKGEASAATTSSQVSETPDKVAKAVKSNLAFTSVAIPVETVAAANVTAKAVAEEIGSAFFEAEGVALGSPQLKAGMPVNISAVGEEFAGKHVLSHVKHVYTAAEGYRTHFEISGRQERTLLGLASLGQTNGHFSQSGPPIYGLVIGIVTQIKPSSNDAQYNGRVKVRFPWLTGEQDQEKYESHWARVVQFGAGKDRGSFFLPEIDDEVLVGFEHGDFSRPFVIGGLYNGVDKPDTGLDKGKGFGDLVDSGRVARRGITSRQGHRLVFIDESSGGPLKSGISIRTSDSKFKVELKEDDSGGPVLHVFGNPKVVIEAEDTLELTSGKDIVMKAGKGNFKLEAGQNAEMKATANFKAEGVQVNIKGSGPAELAGATTTIKGDSMVQVSGPMVKVG